MGVGGGGWCAGRPCVSAGDGVEVLVEAGLCCEGDGYHRYV